MSDKLNLFKDVIPSIMSTKVPVINEETVKEYNAFMVNRALSFHQDTLFQSNQMNLYHDLPKMAQYDFLIRSIRSRKRPFFRWPSQSKDEAIDVVMKAFEYSRTKAIETLRILTENQIDELKKLYVE